MYIERRQRNHVLKNIPHQYLGKEFFIDKTSVNKRRKMKMFQ